MITGGWIWFLPLPWEWRLALSKAIPCELGGTGCRLAFWPVHDEAAGTRRGVQRLEKGRCPSCASRQEP
jgi:hypothetical protein